MTPPTMLQTAPVESFNLNPKSTQQAINLKSDTKTARLVLRTGMSSSLHPLGNQQFLVP